MKGNSVYISCIDAAIRVDRDFNIIVFLPRGTWTHYKFRQAGLARSSRQVLRVPGSHEASPVFPDRLITFWDFGVELSEVMFLVKGE